MINVVFIFHILKIIENLKQLKPNLKIKLDHKPLFRNQGERCLSNMKMIEVNRRTQLDSIMQGE